MVSIEWHLRLGFTASDGFLDNCAFYRPNVLDREAECMLDGNWCQEVNHPFSPHPHWGLLPSSHEQKSFSHVWEDQTLGLWWQYFLTEAHCFLTKQEQVSFRQCLRHQTWSLESNLDASEVCLWALSVNKELLLLVKLWDRSRLKASTRLEQQIRVLSVCVCPGTRRYTLQHYSVAPQGALEEKKTKHSVVFEISSIGLEIAGRWPCKVEQTLPCCIRRIPCTEMPRDSRGTSSYSL